MEAVEARVVGARPDDEQLRVGDAVAGVERAEFAASGYLRCSACVSDDLEQPLTGEQEALLDLGGLGVVERRLGEQLSDLVRDAAHVERPGAKTDRVQCLVDVGEIGDGWATSGELEADAVGTGTGHGGQSVQLRDGPIGGWSLIGTDDTGGGGLTPGRSKSLRCT